MTNTAMPTKRCPGCGATTRSGYCDPCLDEPKETTVSTPAKYRKKPVTIEAIQWDGSAESATPIIDWILAGGGTARFHEAQDAYDDGEKGCPATPAELAIDTLEGTITASPADFIIRGVGGEFYPCKPDIFAKTYEAAGDDE